MKKIVSILLCIAIMFSLSGCFFRVKEGKIGETYTSSSDIEFTLNEVSFAEVIDGWGGANDDFWKPLDETNCNLGGRWPTVAHYAAVHGLKPKHDDDRIVFISYTAKNVSKYDIDIDEVGVLDYDDGYTYSDGALAYRVSEEGVWDELPNGGLSIKKLDDKAYEFRAYMVVPKRVIESDKSLTYTLFGYEFIIR
jgi:hypothetical protein